MPRFSGTRNHLRRRPVTAMAVAAVTGALLVTSQLAVAGSAQADSQTLSTGRTAAQSASTAATRVAAEKAALARMARAGYTQKSCKKKKSDTLYLQRLTVCVNGTWQYEATLDKAVVGTLSMRSTLTGKPTASGSRKVSVTVSLNKIKTTGTVKGGTKITISLPCKGKGCSSPKPRTSTVSSWRKHPSHKFVFTAPTPKTASKIASGKFRLKLKIGHATTSEKVATYRCDHVKYLHYKSGCVFSSAKPVLLYSLSSAIDGPTANNIHDAQTNPAATFPQFDGKSVPGQPASKHPLHRLVNSKKTAANHAAAVATCVAVWGPNYADGGNTCDEYPFRSTKEGAAKGDNRYSARQLPADNSKQSQELLAYFYKIFRIIDSDAYYVDTVA